MDCAGFRQGRAPRVSPDGDPYYPVFTYSFYAGFTDQDIADLWEAFRTVPAVGVAAPPHDVGFPFSFRSGLKLWRAAYLDTPETDALMGTSSPWNRGRQLVEGLHIALPVTRAGPWQGDSMMAPALPGTTAFQGAAKHRQF